jgi:hypothetical protein
MSIAQRVFKHAKDLSDLDELAKLIANPKAISEAAELAKKEAAATQEILDEASAAKAVIAKRDELFAEIQKEKDLLVKNSEDLKKQRDEFAQICESENARLASFSATLNATADQQRLREDELNAERSKADTEKKLLNDRVNLAIAAANERESEAQKAIDLAKSAEAKYEALVAESRLKAANLARIASEL